ncbi:MAG: sigma 54-interacting transcriptional regulator [Desulfobacterales bacterium]|jgi:PAS domain S-box-containing protein
MKKYQSLKESSILCDQWLQILDELNIGAFTVDNQRTISSINNNAQALMGLKAAEVIGKDCREVFVGVPCMVGCMVPGKEDLRTEEPKIEMKDEDEIKHLITRLATPVYGSQREVIGCLTILQDHSPIMDLINRIHHEERRLKVILDNLDIGIFTVNLDNYITFFNKAAEKVSGFDRSEVLGKPCTAIFRGDAAQDLSILTKTMADGVTRNSRQGKIATCDGEIIPIRANYLAVRNEKKAIVGGLATFQDLTLIRQLNQAISDRYTFNDMIGKSPAMQKIFELVNVVAATDATVLVEGSTGTGKDLLVKAIHAASRRSGKPLIKVNCAALPDNLLESEMFGYVKGAFTGADHDKPGRFQEADGGTIFLDEIGDLPLVLQAKLLRVLEDKEFYSLGGRHTIKVDVRIIAATNRGLDKLVEKRLFREDLFYRLNVFRIEIPTLKERRIDLPLLIRHILRRLCVARDNRVKGISESAMGILLNYNYPGNVRELENILEHAVIVCREDIIQPRDLPEYLQNHQTVGRAKSPEHMPVAHNTKNNEREKILQALQDNDWHRQKTSRALGIDRTTLWRKMRQMDISAEPGKI